MSNSQRNVAGRGGSPSSAAVGAAYESPASLLSTARVKVVDLLSGGEIGGLVDGEKSIYLDDTPVKNANDTYNFTGFTYTFNPGTPTQEPLAGFDEIETHVDVGVKITYASSTGVTRTVTDVDADAVKITLRVNAFYAKTDKGDIYGTGVRYKIHVAPNGQGFTQVAEHWMRGTAYSPYQRQILVTLPDKGVGPWQVRVTRDTPDRDPLNVADEIYFESLTTVKYLKMRYPYSSVCGFEFDAKQFSRLPARSYDLYLLLVKVPMNYDPITRVYATTGPGTTGGIWDGTFKTAWTDNPAWCFYDLLTNELFGLGAYIPSAYIDKYTLYTISQYCDELVPDGFGGTEPRFRCNLLLQTREEAMKVVANMASIFRAMVFWHAGNIIPVQDRPKDPVHSYTNANVIDGRFAYSGTPRKSRHTVAIVRWNDPADLYKPKFEYVEDRDGVDELGVREYEVAAFGCTSRGQAYRHGKWALFSEVNETELVEFSVGLEGVYVRPGEVFNVFDRDKAGVRLGGRFISSTTTSAVLDSAVTIEAGKTYTLYITLPDGSLVSKTLTNTPASNVTNVTWSGALTSAPVANAVWGLSIVGNVEPQQFLAISITEESQTTFRIAAKEYLPGKFAAVEQDIAFEEPPTSGFPPLSDGMPSPLNPSVAKTHRVIDGVFHRQLIVSWEHVSSPYLRNYTVSYRLDSGNWEEAATTNSSTVVFDVPRPGIYYIRIVAVSVTGLLSSPSTITYGLEDSIIQTSKITGLELKDQGNDSTFEGDDVRLAWRHNSADTVEELADASSGQRHPLLRGYVVEIFEGDGVVKKIKEVEVPYPQYLYSYDENYRDAEGEPRRELTFRIKAVDYYGQFSEAKSIYVFNPAPEVGIAPDVDSSLIRLTGVNGRLLVNVSPPADNDFEGMLVFVSKSPSFALTDVRANAGDEPKASAMVPYSFNRTSDTDSGMLAYNGKSTQATIELLDGIDYYVILAFYDGFGMEGMNYYGPATVSIPAVDAGSEGITGTITTDSTFVWVREPNDGAWTPNNSGATLTVKFFQGGTTPIAQRTFSVAFSQATGYLTATGGTLNDIAATVVGSGTSSLTINFNYTLTNTDVSISLSSVRGGSSGTPAAIVRVSTDSDIFLHLKSGTVTPTTALLTATVVNISSPTYQWQYWTGAAWFTIVGATSSTYSTASGDFSNSRTFRCLVNGTYSDSLTVTHLYDGTDNRGAFLNNEAHTIACDNLGNPVAGEVGVGGKATTDVFAYRGANQLTAQAGTGPGTGFYYVSATAVNCTFTKTDADTFRIDTATADSGYLTLTFDIEGVTTVTRRFNWSKSKAGADGGDGNDGADAISAGLSNYAHSIPTDASGNGGNFTGAASTMTVYKGATDDSANWTFAQTTSGVTVTASGSPANRTATVTAMSADTGYVEFTASRSGYASLVLRFTLAKAKAGAGGVNGTRTAILDLYQWAASSPTTYPSGSSTYTWATGQFTPPATLNGWTVTPGATVAGQTLWIIRQLYADTGTSATSAVTWSSTTPFPAGGAGTNGNNGSNGQRVGFLEVYAWGAAAPTLPSGTSTYTWATGAFTAPSTPNGWSLTPGAAVAGQTLWGTSVRVSNTGTSATDVVTWTGHSSYAVGGAGANGSNGANSAVVFLYKRSASAPAVPSVTSTYTFSTGVLTGHDNGWTQSVPANDGNPLYITTALATATATTDTITTGEWGTPQILASNGATGAGGLNNATVYLYRRLGSVPAVPSTTATYTFATGVLTGHNNSWTQAVPANDGNPLYVTVATASASTATDTIATGEWASPVVMASNGTNGTNGLNVSTVFLFKRSASAPAVPSTTSTYTFATGVLTGHDNGWTQTAPANDGNPLYYTTATASAATSTDTIATGEWATPQIMASNGATGATGPGINYRGAYAASATYYHNAIRREVVSYSGVYYITNNTGKDGLNTWGTPGVADWTSLGSTYAAVATDLLLAQQATITQTLVMGDGTLNAGILRSYSATGWLTSTNSNNDPGYWFNPRNASNKAEAWFGIPSGARLAFDGTNLAFIGGTFDTGSGNSRFQVLSNQVLFGTTSTAVGSAGILMDYDSGNSTNRLQFYSDGYVRASIITTGGYGALYLTTPTSNGNISLESYYSRLTLGFSSIAGSTNINAKTLTLTAQHGVTVSNDLTVLGNFTAGSVTFSGASVADLFKITNTSGIQKLLMGNQDSTGANNPGMIVGAGGDIAIGGGTSWTDGGTFTAALTVKDDGKTYFGTGDDTNLYRSGANQLKTDDQLIVGNGLFVYGNIETTNGNFYAGGGEIKFGAGGANYDTNIYRVAANTLQTDDTFIAATSLATWGPLYIGNWDTALYRNGADTLWTDDTFGASGPIRTYTGFQAYGTLDVYNGNVARFWNPANTDYARIWTGADNNLIFCPGAAGFRWVNNTDTANLMSLTNGGALTVNGGQLYLNDTRLRRDSAGYLIGEFALEMTNYLWVGRDSTDGNYARIYFGSGADTNLYRAVANNLKTDDSFTVGGNLESLGTIYVGPGGDTNLFRAGANLLKTDDSFIVAGNLDVYSAFSLLAGNAVRLWNPTNSAYASINLTALNQVNINYDTVFTSGLIVFGGAQDVNLYRAAADLLHTDDSFRCGGNLTTNGAATIRGSLTFGWSDDTNLYREDVATLRTDGNFRASTGWLACGGNAFIDGGIVNIGSDTRIYRQSADVLMTDDKFRVKNTEHDGHMIKVNFHGSGDRYAFIDLVGDNTYTDYGLRIIRNNGGANTNSVIRHRGTGNLEIGTDDSASLNFFTAGVTRGQFQSNGNLVVNGISGTVGKVRNIEVSTSAPTGGVDGDVWIQYTA